MPYMLYVFLNSYDQERLPICHPFYYVIEETIQNIVQSPSILDYLAETTLRNSTSFPNEATKNQRIQKIIQYLQNSCPTFSSSDSPSLDAAFVHMCAYLRCGKLEDLKITQKHVYIQKNLVDAWMESYSLMYQSKWALHVENLRMLTFFLRLCLLHGLTAAIKLSFASKETNIKNRLLPYSGLAHHNISSNIFLNFLSQWNSSWFVFTTPFSDVNKYYNIKVPYDKLHCIVFIDQQNPSYHLIIGKNMPQKLAAGYWIVFPEAHSHSYDVFSPYCLKIWDSPPTEDSRPWRLEMPLQSNESYLKKMQKKWNGTIRHGNK